MAMDQTKPTYKLSDLKKAVGTIKGLRMTGQARKDSTELGFDDQDVVSAIQSITEDKFYKTMAANKPDLNNHDVYKFIFKDVSLYLKFQDFYGTMVVSFKRSTSI